MNHRQGNRGTTATLEGLGHVPAGWATASPRAARRGRPWRFKTGLYKGLVALATATFLATGLLVSPVLAIGSGNIDQCANDPAPSSPADGCATSASEWVNGNLNASKSVFREGDSIPYRITFGDIPTDGTLNTVTIEWDTTKSGKHAIDYITDWNESVLDANPCLGVDSCDLGDFDTAPIPIDPQVSGAGVTQIPGVLTLFGGTITDVSGYTYSTGTGFTGDKSASLTITFTADVSDPVLAWGGHIATRQDWGQNNSAVGITGSPYHTRIIEVNGSGGNQDRSLKEDAVIFPSSITIIKEVPGTDPQNFSFTASGGLLPASFSLDDDPDSDLPKQQVFSGIEVFGDYVFTETLPTGWQLNNRSCSVTGESGGSTSNTPANSITVTLVEGQDVTCTFFNGEIPNPSLNVTKTAAEANVDAAGDVINYTITVFNTGNVTLTGVSIDDPLLSNEDCDGVAGAPFVTSGFTIAVGGSLSCTGTYTVTQADIDNNGGGDGDIDNTVTADSNETGPDTADAAVPILRSASLNVTKTATSVDGDNSPPFLVDAVGDVITYSISVQNTGNVTLTGVSIDDPLLSNEDCDGVAGAPFVTSGFTIAVGATLTCTGTYTVTQADLDGNGGGDGDIDNVVTADSNETPEDTDEEAVPLTRSPSLNVTKTAAEASVDAAGDVIHYTITVFNTGNVTLTGVSVNDPLLDNEDCDGVAGAPFVNTGFTINVGGSLTCTGTYTVTQADIDNNGGGDGDIDNVVTADSNETGPDTDEEAVPVIRTPGLNVIKTAVSVDDDNSAPFLVDEAGDVITYSIVVTNTGNVTLTGVSVVDPLLTNEDCDGVAGAPFVNTGLTINVGGSLTCTGSYTVTQADIDNNGGGDGDIDNVVTADSNETGPDTDEEAVPLVQLPSLAIDKVATESSFDSVGDVIHYTITVTNTGNTTLTNVAVTDAQVADLDCDGVAGAPLVTTGFTINVGGSLTCTASHTITQADLDDGHYFNQACADDGAGGAEQDCDDVDTPGDQTPMLDIDKTVVSVDGDNSAPFLVDEAGDVISYSILVTNTGNITLTGVSVSDPLIANLDCSATAGLQTSGFTLAPGATLTCTGTYTVLQSDIDNNGGGDGDIDNTATADSDQTGPDTDSETVPLAQLELLSITKVATESGYDSVGDVIHYTITATNAGNTTLHDVVVTDPDVSDLVCTPTTPVASLAPGASITCTATHTIVQADLDAGSFFNQACVDDANGAAETGADEVCDDVDVPGEQNPELSIVKIDDDETFDSVGDVINYTITATNTGNVTLTDVVVTDDQVTNLMCLPALPVASLAPGASITCVASHTVTQADLDAGSFFNEACVDDGEGGAVEACDDVTTPGDQNPELSITKVAAEGIFTAVGQVIHYTITATNTGNVTLHNVVVTDAQVTDLVCEPGLPVATLAVGATITCTASHTIVQADLDAGFFFNEACVDDGEGGAAEVCDDVTVPGQQAGGETDIPTQPPTDGSLGGGGNAGPAGSAWLLVIGLGILLAVTVLLTPNRKRKEVVQESQDRE